MALESISPNMPPPPLPLSEAREARLDSAELRTEPEAIPKTNNENGKFSIKDFISNALIKWTTMSSAAVNLVSAPIRLFDEKNPLKQLINKVSMIFTRSHLLTYSAAGLFSAFEQKNPLLVFSFLIEGLAALCGLRNVYLFRGIGTGVDGMVAGIKDKHKKSKFDSYTEGWKHSTQAIKATCQEFLSKISKDPLHMFKLTGDDLAILSSLMAAIGGVLGMTVNEKLGAGIRDLFGAGGDYGILKMDSANAKASGTFYFAGSIVDFTGRLFNHGVAKILKIKNTNAFEKLKDAFYEAAIALDRLGQYFFLRYNQESDDTLKNSNNGNGHSLKQIVHAAATT